MKLIQFIKSKKIKNIPEMQIALVGKKINILNKTKGAHSFPLGVQIVQSVSNAIFTGIDPYVSIYIQGNTGHYSIYNSEFEILNLEKIEDFEDEIKELKKEISVKEKLIAKYEQRISFMNVHNIDEFSEEDYKILTTLEYIEDNNLSKVEKARALGKMLKGEEV